MELISNPETLLLHNYTQTSSAPGLDSTCSSFSRAGVHISIANEIVKYAPTNIAQCIRHVRFDNSATLLVTTELISMVSRNDYE